MADKTTSLQYGPPAGERVKDSVEDGDEDGDEDDDDDDEDDKMMMMVTTTTMGTMMPKVASLLVSCLYSSASPGSSSPLHTSFI